MSFYLFLCCLLSGFFAIWKHDFKWFRFDFHGHFLNQISNKIALFQCDFKSLKIVLKWFKIRLCKIGNQIVEYPAAKNELACYLSIEEDERFSSAVFYVCIVKLTFDVLWCDTSDARFFLYIFWKIRNE
jgi:hypothetical protein